MPPKDDHWRRTAAVFHERADEYDSWYEDSLLFEIELAALNAARGHLRPPSVEVGCGPGRFTAALGIDMGIDPAFSPLVKARQRGVVPIRARGEELPLKDKSMGSLFLILTLCFIDHPRIVLRECHRVLKPGARLLVGLIPASSSWGKSLTAKGQAGHPYYRFARLLTIQTVTDLLAHEGFDIVGGWSSLYQRPESLKNQEKPRRGLDERSGFSVIVAEKQTAKVSPLSTMNSQDNTDP